MTVTVYQGGNCHQDLKRAFRSIVQGSQLPRGSESARGGGLDRLLHGSTQTRLLMGTVVAVKHTHLHSLINLAERSAHAGLNSGLGLIARCSGISIASCEATLHQGAQSGLVGLVVKTVALGDLNAFLGRLVIGH